MNKGNSHIYYFVGPTYHKLEERGCNSWHGNYNNLTEAEEDCNLDNNCQAVYDNGCHGTGPLSNYNIHLCPMNATYEINNSSCVYEKGKICSWVAKGACTRIIK